MPGPRLLWDYNSSESWAHRLEKLKVQGFSERLLTLEDLEICGKGRATGKEIDKGLVDAMARWCEGVDEFGSLLWMTTLLN